MFFFFKQKTAYEMRISDWSSDVCSSDLGKVLDQFSNPDNPRAHIESTGPELWKQTGGEITHFVSAMGTTGTIMGVRAYCLPITRQIRYLARSPPRGPRFPGFASRPTTTSPAFNHRTRPTRLSCFCHPNPQVGKASGREKGGEEG